VGAAVASHKVHEAPQLALIAHSCSAAALKRASLEQAVFTLPAFQVRSAGLRYRRASALGTACAETRTTQPQALHGTHARSAHIEARFQEPRGVPLVMLS
jgi:hypothetical protein